MTNITDIIKNSFLEEFTAISIPDALIAIALSFLLSLFVLFIYRITYGGISYSKSFANCLILLTMVTTVVILVISSNVVLSLGMVGALSIVRFRTAIKEPADTAFMFWAIATGIVCGAGYVGIAIVMTVLVGLLFVLIISLSKKQKKSSYMVVVRYTAGSAVSSKIALLPRYALKNKNICGDNIELVAEVELSKKDMDALEDMRALDGVQEIAVMRSVSGSVL